MNIVAAMHSPKVFRPLFRDLATWHAWEVYLSALFGLPVASGPDADLMRACTGLDVAPPTPSRESFVICGRRSGKSFISAVVASYLAGYQDWSAYLGPGERGWLFVIANDKQQASIVKGYVSGIFRRVPALRALVEKETIEALELRNGVNVSVKTSSFRTLRGYTVIAAILEEAAFWRSDESANPDREVLAALRPALSTVPASMLLAISTPYSRAGVLFEAWKSFYGQAGGPLVWRAPSLTMNPTLDRGLIQRAMAEDPQAASAEWLAEWRSDVEAFISAEMVSGVTVPGRFELPRVAGVDYYGFADPSGGRQDSFTLALAHAERGRVVLDVLRERHPPFQPAAVVEEFAAVLRSYGVREVVADKYAGEWVPEAFRKHGVDVRPSDLTASELYLSLLPSVANGTVELLDQKRLASQLAGLERRVRVGGRDLVTHYPGGHDDAANALAGVVHSVTLSAAEGYGLVTLPNVLPEGSDGYVAGGGLDSYTRRMIREGQRRWERDWRAANPGRKYGP